MKDKATNTQQTMDTLPPLPDGDRAEIKRRAKMLLWLSAEEIAHAKFPSLCALYDDLLDDALDETKEKGKEKKERSPRPRNATYTSDFFARQMLESLATVLENRHIEHVRKSPAVAVIVDDSTDDANIKQLSVVVRYLLHGAPRLAFLGLIDIPEGGAETVFSETAKLLTSKGITVGQVLAFGSDGASPMTGTDVLLCFEGANIWTQA